MRSAQRLDSPGRSPGRHVRLKQPPVDGAGAGLQLVEIMQAPQAAQIAWVVDDGLDAQRAPVIEVLLDAGVPVEGVDVHLGAVGDDLGLELTGRRPGTL